MGKLGTDVYLSNFDRYGGGKSVEKKHKGDRDKKKKDKSEIKKEQSLKKLNENLLKMSETLHGRIDDLDRSIAKMLRDGGLTSEATDEILSRMNSRIDDLEKVQKEAASQIKSIKSTQKALKRDLEATASQPPSEE